MQFFYSGVFSGFSEDFFAFFFCSMALSIKALAPRPNGRLAPVGAVEFFFVAKEKEIKKKTSKFICRVCRVNEGGGEKI